MGCATFVKAIATDLQEKLKYSIAQPQDKQFSYQVVMFTGMGSNPALEQD